MASNLICNHESHRSKIHPPPYAHALTHHPQLWVYPIKALRGIPLQDATLGPQGIKHDRTFMICRVADDGTLQKLQLSSHPQCALFRQEIINGDSILVRYLTPDEPLVPRRPEHDAVLDVPLEPDTAQLDRADVNLHQSMVSAYRMGPKYDAWFSACFGFDTALLYIGDARRPILGTFSPKSQQKEPQKGWLSSLTSYVTGSTTANEPDWLAFSDMAPYLIATESSLANVRQRLVSGDVDMVKFRPNIVVDGESQWDEDFWACLSLRRTPAFLLSKMCGRCTSVNVDYATGRTAEGEHGAVLKKLMSDRRVDPGHKYSPVFGRYGFLSKELAAQDGGVAIAVGDDMAVETRNDERPAWDWPMKDPAAARFYSQTA